MIDNKPFAMFFNASPRKGWNTHKMLEAAKAGAEEAGAVTELVNLYDIKFPGCKSCFACKLKNTQTLAAVFGASETLYACNTYQFADYSRYCMTLFTEEEKRAYRDAHVNEDLANARTLGKRLVEKALANAPQSK